MRELYNPHNHNHIEWANERLDERAMILSKSLREIEHCPERKAQIQTELGILAFETWMRYEEGKYEPSA